MTKILLDADTGIDDALAIAFLLAQPDVDLMGVACTAGNVGVDHVARNTLDVLDLFRAPALPVARGADLPLIQPFVSADEVHGSEGLGYARLERATRSLDSRTAARLWVDMVHAHPGEIVGLVTGPFTNLALALRLEPRLLGMLKGLVVMGGSFDHRGNVGGTAEWNIFVDPEAAAMVLEEFRGRDLGYLPVFCGLEVTERVLLTPAHLGAVRARTGETKVTRFLDDLLRLYFEFHEQELGSAVAPLHDPLAAVVAAGRSIGARRRAASIGVELRGELTRGMTVPDWRGEADEADVNGLVVREVDVEEVLRLVVDAFASLSSGAEAH